ncbi:MAG TPA: alpha/beta hydrolase [Trinickia sp.]|jgi:3-oxoadipate enol-lactonase|nr:alpha/beta hydrolase [Trinickia sp.]
MTSLHCQLSGPPLRDRRATVDTITARLRITSPEGNAARCDVIGAADLREDIERIARPTLVIAGQHDPVTTVEDTRFIAERVPGARLVELGSAHLSNIEAAAAFNEAVLRFLGE